jgi:hypothetical protein
VVDEFQLEPGVDDVKYWDSGLVVDLKESAVITGCTIDKYSLLCRTLTWWAWSMLMEEETAGTARGAFHALHENHQQTFRFLSVPPVL